MRVTVLGHASLFFETKDERILLDPVLRTTSLLGSLVHQYPRVLNIERMPAPSLLVITHAHYDHFDPTTLEKLPKDIPVVIPPDQRMERQLKAIGFAEFRRLATWEGTTHGAVRLVATPSDAPVTEFGLLVETDHARLWHMSDAEPPPGTARKIISDYGPVDVVSVKFQPADPQLNFQHNLGASFDRRSVALWLENACACRPKLAFPYASGLCFPEERGWMNRYAYPFSPEYISEVIGKRLTGTGSSTVVKPGDTISIEKGHVSIEEQVSAFVRQCDTGASIEWEPVEDQYLRGISRHDDRQAFKAELTRILVEGELCEWLKTHRDGKSALLKRFHEWRVLCQFVVHMDVGERMYFQIDFTSEIPEVRLGKTASASYFMHIGGDAARRLVAGKASPLEVMLEGSVRIYDRIISIRNDHIDAPDAIRLYEDFPDPLLCFGGGRRRSSRTSHEPVSV